jgi:HSP20 family protein
MKLEHLKENMSAFWGGVAEGWRHLWTSARHALTRFRPSEKTQLPKAEEIEDRSFERTLGWAMLGGEVFEDENRVVVRVELPGMDKNDLDIQVQDGDLVISGEKRFASESTRGCWHRIECAYGSFSRVIPLPAAVQTGAARATYRDGILRVELPKLSPGLRKARSIPIE